MGHSTVSALRAACVLACASGSATAQSVQPQGLYFHTFTGAATGSEWSTWGPLGSPGRYEFSDLRAGGTYRATFNSDNSFVFDAGVGSGAFTGPDEAFINFNFGGGVTFASQLVRAPYTDASFPVFAAPAVQGDTGLDGDWLAQIHNVDPATGDTLSVLAASVAVDVQGTTVRLTQADGAFYQGVWRSDWQAGFRVVDLANPNPKYRSFPGSQTSFDENMVGDLRVTGENSLTFAVFLETEGPLGTQVQTMQYMELTRVPSAGATGLMIACCIRSTRRRRR